MLRHWTFCFHNFENCNERTEGSLEAVSGTGLLGLMGLMGLFGLVGLMGLGLVGLMGLFGLVGLTLPSPSTAHKVFFLLILSCASPLCPSLSFSFHLFSFCVFNILSLSFLLCISLVSFVYFLLFVSVLVSCLVLRLCFHIRSLSAQPSDCLITVCTVSFAWVSARPVPLFHVSSSSALVQPSGKHFLTDIKLSCTCMLSDSIPGTTRVRKAVGLERGPLSLVSTTEELLD
jgi:hypothetical protein